MKKREAQSQVRSVSRFTVTRGQMVLAVMAIASILALGFSTFGASKATIRQAKVMSDVETPAASIIFTQRETLAYAVRLAQWANGGTPRRSVQIARSLLAQRLAVIDTSGRSMGSRAQRGYWDVLKKSDEIVASAPAGILPEQLHTKIDTLIAPIIDEILAETRRFVVQYQRSFDQEMIDAAVANANRDRTNLIFFYIFLLSGGFFLLFNVRSNFKNYQLAGDALKEEQRRLDATLGELSLVQSSLIELKNLDTAKDAFISTVNHELRTPLTSIIGYLDLIRDENMTEKSPELLPFIEVLERNAQILLTLVESMLAISKLDSAEGKLSESKVSVNEVIDNAIFVLKPASEKSEIPINITAAEELFVEGDAGQLSQVYINLIANAIKFSPRRSVVEVISDMVKKADGREYSRVQVRDHGIGIPKEDIDHLFTRFFRAKNADQGQFPGTGLGLSIVQRVVSQHGGTISVSSVLGEGTTFTVEIPLYLTSEEKMILDRRNDVLARAVATFEKATPSDIKSIAHELGGAIGFYGFDELSRELLEFSRTPSASELSTLEFAEVKSRLLHLMRSQLEAISNG